LKSCNKHCKFHLQYVAKFQQHLHMEYIPHSWSDIPELVVSIMISLRVGATSKACKRVPSDLESFTVATITWLAVTEYQCHKWPRICSVYRNHIPVLSSCLAYHRVCAHYIWYLFYCCKINTQDLLTPPEHMESSRLLVRLVLLFIFCVVLYRSLLVLLFLFLVSDCIICLSMDGFW
jgi:hypothetical protein